jgi:hypothetical protein
MKRWIKALIAAVIVLGIAFYFENRRSPSSVMSEENQTILTAPDSVKAYSTVGFLTNSPADSEKTLQAFYQKETNFVPVPQDAAERVVRIITVEDRTTDHYPSCIYTPGFVMTFIQGDKSIDIFFCFECGGIMMKKSGEPKIQDLGLTSKYGKELRDIFKKLFPSDPKVQKL